MSRFIAVVAGLGGAAEVWIVGLLVLAAVLGVLVVLPIGGADMPVVISLLNALTGLSAAAAGLALDNTAMIVAGMIVGASGSILTNQMAVAMNRTIPAIVAGGFGGTATLPGAGAGVERTVRSTSRSTCGRSWRRISRSLRSTETTIIAAVRRGRRPSLAEPASQAERTRVCGRRTSLRTSRGPWRSSAFAGPWSMIGMSTVGPNRSSARCCARADSVPGTTMIDGESRW